VQHALVDVLVVHAQDAVAVRIVGHREVVHAVVVRADLLFLLVAVVAVDAVIGRGGAVDRVAPGNQHLRLVAYGQGRGIGPNDRNRVETQRRVQAERRPTLRRRRQGSGPCIGDGSGSGRREKARDRGAEAAREDLAARQPLLDDAGEMRVVRMVAHRLVAVVFDQLDWRELLTHGCLRCLRVIGRRQEASRGS
jgi:hypothetical protein